MKAIHQPFRLIKALQTEFEAWTGIFRFLVGFKSNSDFDGFFSRQVRPGLRSGNWPPGSLDRPEKIRHTAIISSAPEHRWVPVLRLCLLIAILFVTLTPVIWAHGGASVNIDNCRIPVENQWVHFTAYTPTHTKDKEYCRSIPNLGGTNLVFDYESKVLRKMTVEFEITKEPEGTRVYHQDPKAHQSGSVNAVVDFSGYGPGEYLAHVTLVNGGKEIDAHLPFSVGSGSGFFRAIWLVGCITLSGLLVVYFFRPKIREKFNRISQSTPSSRIYP